MIEYSTVVRIEHIKPRWWLSHMDAKVQKEARHAYWVEHLEESFWKSWSWDEVGR